MKFSDFRLSKKAAPYVFISPFFIFFAIFGAFPIFFSLFLSFFNWDGINQMQFVGLENYAFVLTDSWFWQSIYNTLVIGIMTTIPQHIIAILLAFILAKGTVKFKEFFRTAYFLPYVTIPVAIALVFGTLYGSPFGILNVIIGSMLNWPIIGGILESLGFEFPVRWLSDPSFIRPSVAAVVTWRNTGWNMIIYYAGLQQIPEALYEAAEVDGASLSQSFFKITLPLLKPVMFFAMLMSIIGNLMLFDEPMILLDQMGGTGRAGLTTAMYLYRTGFGWREFGTGSAMAYILCFFIVVASVIFNKYFDREI